MGDFQGPFGPMPWVGPQEEKTVTKHVGPEDNRLHHGDIHACTATGCKAWAAKRKQETGEVIGHDVYGEYVIEKHSERGYPGVGHGGGPPDCPSCKRAMQYDGPGVRCYTCGIYVGPGASGGVMRGAGGSGGSIAAGGCVPIGHGMGSSMFPPPGWIPAAPLPIADEKKTAEILHKPVLYVEKTSDTSVNYEFLNLSTQEARDIVGYVLPEIMNRFLTKNKDYEHFPEGDLGPKAHFVGIYRKIGKLRKGLWDGEALEHEQLSEVIDDLVGHLLLARLGLEDDST